MKHKKCTQLTRNGRWVLFYKLRIPRIQMQSVSNGLRRPRIKTWRQCDVMSLVQFTSRYDPFSKCQLHLRFWNRPSQVPKTCWRKRGTSLMTEMKLSEQQQGRSQWQIKQKVNSTQDCGSKRSQQENISTKNLYFIGSDLLSQVIQCFLKG